MLQRKLKQTHSLESTQVSCWMTMRRKKGDCEFLHILSCIVLSDIRYKGLQQDSEDISFRLGFFPYNSGAWSGHQSLLRRCIPCRECEFWTISIHQSII